MHFLGQYTAEKVEKNYFHNSNKDFMTWIQEENPVYSDIEKKGKKVPKQLPDSARITSFSSQITTLPTSRSSLTYIWRHNKILSMLSNIRLCNWNLLTTVIGLIVFFSSIYFGVPSFCTADSPDSFIFCRLVGSKVTIF